MTITPTLFETSDFLGLYEDKNFSDLSTYWSSTYFTSVHLSDSEFIDMEQLVPTRKVAPFVAPMSQGRPIFKNGSKLTRFKPAYIKLLDPVNPQRTIRRRPGEYGVVQPMAPAARHAAIVADIFRQHDAAIRRKWELMAARAVIDGTLTLESPDYPMQFVDFQRDPSHMVTKGVGTRWNDAGVSIIADLNTWRQRTRQAMYGGPVNRLTVGTDVWEVMRKSDELKDELDTNFRGTTAELKRGLREGERVEFMGRLSSNLDVYVYSDQYEHEETGVMTDVLSPKDIVLTGPNISGIMAFGIIPEKSANFQAMPIFPRSYTSQNPEVEHVLTQSSPLPVPVNPNASLKATVLV